MLLFIYMDFHQGVVTILRAVCIQSEIHQCKTQSNAPSQRVSFWLFQTAIHHINLFWLFSAGTCYLSVVYSFVIRNSEILLLCRVNLH
jgi:hypothetical protein